MSVLRSSEIISFFYFPPSAAAGWFVPAEGIPPTAQPTRAKAIPRLRGRSRRVGSLAENSSHPVGAGCPRARVGRPALRLPPMLRRSFPERDTRAFDACGLYESRQNEVKVAPTWLARGFDVAFICRTSHVEAPDNPGRSHLHLDQATTRIAPEREQGSAERKDDPRGVGGAPL